MKILKVSNKVITYSLGAQNEIETLLSMGHEIIWAADFSYFLKDTKPVPVEIRQISIHTNPLKKCNLQAFRQICNIIENEKIDAIICSTPIGGFLARIAAKRMGIKPVIYAAHGFLFFHGAPLINRTVYRLEEVLLAPWTDVLITINKEDYEAAKSFRLRGQGKLYMIHGAGVSTGVKVEKSQATKRQELNLSQDGFVLVSAGELNQNKNNRIVIKAIALLNDSRIHYVVCGDGTEREKLEQLSKELGIDKQVHFLGYRTDISEIMAAADAFVMPSFREGVPRSLLEAMDLGLPCIGSKTRGIADLIEDGTGGYLCNPRNAEEFSEAFGKLMSGRDDCERMGTYNRGKAKGYASDIVRSEYRKIFTDTLAPALEEKEEKIDNNRGQTEWDMRRI